MARAVVSLPQMYSQTAFGIRYRLSRTVFPSQQIMVLSGARSGGGMCFVPDTLSRSTCGLSCNGTPNPSIIIRSKITNGNFLSVRTAKTARKEIVQSKRSQEGGVTIGTKVKQAGKDATYTGIVLLGIGVTGIMFFAVGRELFSGDSPNGVYTRAFKLCKKSEELIDAIGEPMKGYGELTRRGRRRHTSHTEFEVEGQKMMRMKFYVEGPLNKGTAQLEVRKNEGKYQFRYLFVTIDAYPHQTIIIEDNR